MAENAARDLRVVPVDELLDDRHLLDALLEYSPDHIYFKDRQSRFVRVSRSLAEWMGLADPRDAIGRSDADFFAAEHAQKARKDEDLILRTGEPLVGIEERELWPDGRETWVSTTKVPLFGHEGRIIGIFGMSRDVNARKAAEDLVTAQATALAEQAQLLRDLASKDDLTGLLNRRAFFDAAEVALAAMHDQSHHAAMFFIDLDGLKQINDDHGHAAGDRALVAVADALQTLCTELRLVGRIGGDEFCILETAPRTKPLLCEACLQDAIAQAAAVSGLPVELSASVGQVDATPADDLAQLVARSDRQMYARKARRSSAQG